MKKWLRRLLGTLLGLLLVLTLLLGLGLALLQTDWARAQILRLAEQGLREQGLELELQGLDGFLPVSIELRALDLADRQGTWLEVRGLVDEITEQGSDEHIDDLAELYLNQRPYPFRQEGEVRVIYKIKPQRVQAVTMS